MKNSSGPGLASPVTSISGITGPTLYGYTAVVAPHFNENPASACSADNPCEPGRVVRVDRSLVLVAVGVELLHLPYPLEAGVPATGDLGIFIGPNRAGDRQILGRLLPRRSELSRKRAFEDSSAGQVLAANMDVIGVVVPVDRPLDAYNRLERTLVAAWDSGATPLVIITKVDLGHVADDVVGEVILQAGGVSTLDARPRRTGTGSTTCWPICRRAAPLSCWGLPAQGNPP